MCPYHFRASGAAPEDNDVTQGTQRKQVVPLGRSVASIQVRSGIFVDQIRFEYRDGSVRSYGIPTGTLHAKFSLRDDEYITGIEYKQGREHLKEIRFRTNHRTSDMWGGGDPNREVQEMKASLSNPIVDLVSANAAGFCPRIDRFIRLND